MITAIEMGSREAMVAFCRGIQLACPVGSYILPEPGALAGSAVRSRLQPGRDILNCNLLSPKL
jgi:cystathionine beta-lyase family protein involved in aluminum resistance